MRAVSSACTALPEGGEIIVVDDRGGVPARESLKTIVNDGGAGFGRSRKAGALVIDDTGPPGPSAARSAGAHRAIHPVAPFPDDDELLPDHCGRIPVAVDDSPDATRGAAAVMSGRPSGREVVRKPDWPTGKCDSTAVRDFRGSGGSGFRARRDAPEMAGGSDGNLRFAEDGEPCARFVTHGAVTWIDAEPGLIVRTCPGTSGNRSLSRAADLRDRAGRCGCVPGRRGDFRRR